MRSAIYVVAVVCLFSVSCRGAGALRACGGKAARSGAGAGAAGFSDDVLRRTGSFGDDVGRRAGTNAADDLGRTADDFVKPDGFGMADDIGKKAADDSVAAELAAEGAQDFMEAVLEADEED